MQALIDSFNSLASHRLLMFGGKGGVGKTTLASLAALHFSKTRETILFSTDPASNLLDLFGTTAKIRIEQIDASLLYRKFLGENLESFLELGDRGTYLDRDEIARFFELALPGIDELMGWLRIGQLAEENRDALVIVDTAPTGHTLRLFSSSAHFAQLGEALESMQEKHRDLVAQLARRRMRDRMDEFLERFQQDAERRRLLIADAQQSAFVAVFLADPWVVAQTERLVEELRGASISVPMAILNQAAHDCDCARCRQRSLLERDAITRLARSVNVVRAPRSCSPLGSVEQLEAYLRLDSRGSRVSRDRGALSTLLDALPIPATARMIFFAGKGGVGKTSSATSVALQLAAAGKKTVLISVDPAHSVRDVFANEKPPENLTVETIDTKQKWRRLRESLGSEIERAVEALTPRGMSLAHDTNVMKQLLAVAPPGADELFAIMRLADLVEGDAFVVVDTAPTGHFLRLLELPKTAGEWVREFMRLLLKYKELIPPSSLGQELLNASRALTAFDAALRSESVATFVVTRPEPLVMRETSRLLASLQERGMRVPAVIANYATPESDCSCDRIARAAELEELGAIDRPFLLVERRDRPPTTMQELGTVISI